MSSVLMIAAEHGGLPGGKVGGIGDVIAELPPALVNAGLSVSVLLPSYGVYHELPGSQLAASADVAFAGSVQRIGLYELPKLGGAGCWVIHHPVFGAPAGQIYHHDSADSPFATDANIYALFCAAALELLVSGALALPDVVHLHDWHAATFALLCRTYVGEQSERSKALSELPIVYTVHNLALQGVRPLQGHPSALSAWFPSLELPIESIRDPRYPDCYNPMRAGIVLADRVHVVSPTYAREVLLPNALEIGRHGGEGLELDLAARSAAGDLFGILNGCEYAAAESNQPLELSDLSEDRRALVAAMDLQLAQWLAKHEQMRSSDYLARKTLDAATEHLLGPPKDCFLITSVGRVTSQKVGLLLAVNSDLASNVTLLDTLLGQLGTQGLLVMLGSGDQELEAKLVEHAARHSNFLFLRGYSETLADHLYRSGDLFLMPSLFEPCGISQLLAMREGQPCLVHAVGGLCDTVTPDTGFVFDGENMREKAQAASAAFAESLHARSDDEAWLQRRTLAAANRFTWADAAVSYKNSLYEKA